MSQRETVDKDALNAGCERFLAHFLRGQIEELEEMGAGDIVYAERARAYLRRYAAAEAASRQECPAPQKGRHLRLVG